MQDGIYDQLLTRQLEQLLREIGDAKSQIDRLEDADRPEYLARYLARQVRGRLRAYPRTSDGSDGLDRKQVEFINLLLTALNDAELSGFSADPVVFPAQTLKAVYRTANPPQQPGTPLSGSHLILNSSAEPKLGFELERELRTADRVLMIVSFLQWRGWQRLRDAFEDLARLEKPVRILTTTYIGATDYRALEALSRLPNVQLRISLDGRRRRLHAKSWLFERANGFSSVYVGSANLSAPALEDGIEWTVKLSEVDSAHIVDRFRGAFDSLWEDPEFEAFDPEDEGVCRRVREALKLAKEPSRKNADGLTAFFDLRPHPYQQATLDQLESERVDRGHTRNLVVAPTGTGKTLVAAFDYQRQIGRDGVRPRLLFLAHREEILRQARSAFRHVLRDESFGSLLTAGENPDRYDLLFATIQSMHSRDLIHLLGPGYWHFVVLDEAHHVPAESYRELVAALRPRILLGLTATPERTDGLSILPWFGNRIADEMRLWHAIERQYLVPFDYYGIHDGTDLSKLSWSRGSYQKSELDIEYLNNVRRAKLVVQQFRNMYSEPSRARAIGFCVSVEHARFMAGVFREAGIPAEALTGQSPHEQRREAPQRLRRGEIQVLFTVDLFNEGVDIPEIDCVLFLRPTESATVFIQQLGRGLRLNPAKTSCLVLDFIGNQRREFRFDLRFRALFGGTRQQVVRQLETGITNLPGNCFFRLDAESQRVILQNLKSQLTANRARMVQELQSLAETLGHTPSMELYLQETQFELEDLYKESMGSWTRLLHQAGLLREPVEEQCFSFTKRFRHLLHMDCLDRMELYESAVQPGYIAGSETLAEQRAFAMLTHRVLQAETRNEGCTEDTVPEYLRKSAAEREEFLELLRTLRSRVRVHLNEKPFRKSWPIVLHRTYTRDEVLFATGYRTIDNPRECREGRLLLPDENTEIFFVTLAKTEKHFSPTTRYEDYAISPKRFHWQSQSTTSPSSATGRRYVEQRSNRMQFLLFVRAAKGDAFVFLGPLNYVSHTGSRPMSITWELESAMPAGFFEVCAALRAA
ncbi:MAG: DUF3427 domain-containing protein [Bryobacterales bacterium]|nr:DUF3427 domain-containing protein [Bryobacterales bacterium]